MTVPSIGLRGTRVHALTHLPPRAVNRVVPTRQTKLGGESSRIFDEGHRSLDAAGSKMQVGQSGQQRHPRRRWFDHQFGDSLGPACRGTTDRSGSASSQNLTNGHNDGDQGHELCRLEGDDETAWWSVFAHTLSVHPRHR
jgi:hypothetical protein